MKMKLSGSEYLVFCVIFTLASQRVESASVSWKYPLSTTGRPFGNSHALRTEAEKELAAILEQVVPLMAIVRRPKRNKQSSFSSKRAEFYTRKYEIMNQINQLAEEPFNMTYGELDMDSRPDLPNDGDNATTTESSGDIHGLLSPLDIHIHVGKKKESAISEKQSSEETVIQRNNTIYDSLKLQHNHSMRDFAFYDDEWDGSLEIDDGSVMGLRPPPSPYARNVSNVSKVVEPSVNREDQANAENRAPLVKFNHLNHSWPPPQPGRSASSLNNINHYERQPLNWYYVRDNRRESNRHYNRQFNSRETFNVTRAQPYSREDYSYLSGGYYYSGSDHYSCCLRQTALVVLSLVTLALLAAYLIVVVTTTQSTGRKKRSGKNLNREEIERELDVSTWVSFVSGIWDASDFPNDAIADACTLKALCQMSRIASSSGTDGVLVALSSLPISYLLHERHDHSGFTRYLNASFVGYNGVNCAIAFHSCPFQMLQ